MKAVIIRGGRDIEDRLLMCPDELGASDEWSVFSKAWDERRGSPTRSGRSFRMCLKKIGFVEWLLCNCGCQPVAFEEVTL